LVRDFQRVIHVVAMCWQPQLQVTPVDVTVFGQVTVDKRDMSFEQSSTTVTVRNASSGEAVRLRLVQEMEYFQAQFEDGSRLTTLQPSQSVLIHIGVNVEAARADIDDLRRMKYAQARCFLSVPRVHVQPRPPPLGSFYLSLPYFSRSLLHQREQEAQKKKKE
jgi:hypothetical protein